MKFGSLVGCLLTVAAFCGTTAASAGVVALPDVSISGGNQGSSTIALTGPGTVALGDGSVSASLVGPSVSASVLSSPGAEQLYSQITYWFEVVGPPDATVPISTEFWLSTTASGADGYSFAYMTGAEAVLGQASAFEVCSTTGFNSCENVTASAMLGVANGSVLTNTEYELTLSAEAYYDGSAFGPPPLPGEASAVADPLITVDELGYTLDFSPGVVNAVNTVSSVPEPSSLPMLLAGLGLIGGRIRVGRKRRAVRGQS